MFAISNARYLPAEVTVAEVQNLSVGNNPVADYRGRRDLKRNIMRVQNVAVEPNPNVTVAIRENARSIEESHSNSMNHSAVFDLFCSSLFFLQLNSTADISNYPYRYSFWLLKPTVADKIFLGLELNDEDKSIADEFGVEEEIEKGHLPIPLDSYIKTVFKRTTERTVSERIDIPTEGVDVKTEYSSVGTLLILKGIAMDKPPDNTYTTELKIKVDDKDFSSLRAWAMSGSTYDVPFFVPCIDSFSLRLETNTAISNYNMRYRYSEVRLTDYVKMLLDLIPRETDEDLYRKVRAGII